MWSARGSRDEAGAWRAFRWSRLALVLAACACGGCLAAAVIGVGWPVSLTRVIAAGAAEGGVGPVAGVSLVSAVLPGDADQPTDGTLAISPNLVNAGSPQTFTLTFTASMRLVNGAVILQVPAGWAAPVQTAGSAGYTTCAACTLITNPSAMTITITGLLLAPPGTTTAPIPSSIAVMYSATVPSSAASDTFTATAQQTLRSALLSSGSAPVTVTPLTSTPASTPAS